MKFLLLICALLSLGNTLASDLDFILVNHTNSSFEGVYVSAANDKDWDGNLLPEGSVLAKGGRIDVKFAPTEKSEKWDLNVVDADGVAVTFTNIDLAGAGTIKLKVVDGKITAEVD
jgi:hypothetical protein